MLIPSLSRPRSGAGLLLVVVLIASGCSGGDNRHDVKSVGGSIIGLTVDGDPGAPPTVRMAAPLHLPASQDETVVTGSGPPVQIDQLFILQLTLYDARTGLKAASTYDTGQEPLLAKTTDDTLFPALSTALVGKRQGSRIALALTGADAYGSGGTPPPGVRVTDPLVVVADVVSVPPVDVLASASGTTVAPPPDAPPVQVVAGDPTTVLFPRTRQDPLRVVVIPLIHGTGPVVRNHSLVTIDYLGQAQGSSLPFLDTYFKEPAVVPVGAQLSVPAWDRALVGVRRGSRLLVIAPAVATRVPLIVTVPSHATIAWVIDVLGVS